MYPDKAITVGKFEALHLGHKLLIESTMQYARKNNLASGVLSFVPHPVRVLYDTSYNPMYSKEEQAFLIDEYGIDEWIPYPFDRDFAAWTPQQFCEMLKEKLSCRAIFVGEDFQFGSNREGTQEALKAIGKQLGINVITISNIINPFDESQKVSTSLIREYLTNGKVEEANRLLGRPFLVMGTVTGGRQLGRTIGFPTANVYPAQNKLLPPNGVYVAGITVKGRKVTGVTNIGTNPTVTGYQDRRVEVHIFDFDEDIYGKDILVELYSFIRPEQTFKNIKELSKQIAKDSAKARGFFV